MVHIYPKDENLFHKLRLATKQLNRESSMSRFLDDRMLLASGINAAISTSETFTFLAGELAASTSQRTLVVGHCGDIFLVMLDLVLLVCRVQCHGASRFLKASFRLLDILEVIRRGFETVIHLRMA